MALVVTAGLAVPVLAGSAAGQDRDCSSTRSTTRPAYPGRSASRVYDWVDADAQRTPRFVPDAEVPAALLRDRYVPQGLAGWPDWDGSGEDLLLVSAYHDADADKVADGPSAVFAVVADGPRAGTALGPMLVGTGHVGGLAVEDGWLYLGSEHEIRGYRLAAVREALVLGPGTATVQPPDYRRASNHDVAFLGSGDSRVWAGRYHQSSSTPLTSYVQTSRRSGTLVEQPDTGAVVPPQTQGVLVTAGYAVFSSSYGRLSRGRLWVVPRAQAGTAEVPPSCFRAPTMNEGVTELGGRLCLLFESGAATYDHGLLRPANPVTRVHSADLAGLGSLDLEVGGSKPGSSG